MAWLNPLNLIRILKKAMIENQRSWHSALPNSLWADRVTPKSAIGVSPYTLVYGKESILPPNIMLPSSILAQESRGSDDEVLQIRIYNLLKQRRLDLKPENTLSNIKS